MIAKPASFDFGALAMGGARLSGFFALILVLAPIHLVYTTFRPDDPFRIPQLFHRLLLRLLGFRMRVHGAIAVTAPVLFVSNHSSYLDIPVLGALIPSAFVAKADVARWPLFGFLAKLQRTVFIERRPSLTHDHGNNIRARLERGQNLILFPEGTSSDGLGVLPFKSGLFGAIEENFGAITIQPVSIACTGLDGLPITRAWRPYYTWFGDMTLVGHLWNVFKFGRFTVDVVFHTPVSPAMFPDRKSLAAYCRQEVAQGIERCLAGRDLGAARMPHVMSNVSHVPDTIPLPVPMENA
jgi:1-acyl-sn-glycerol-3-phosphate acyltransferase